jgi:hypothetical protein
LSVVIFFPLLQLQGQLIRPRTATSMVAAYSPNQEMIQWL